MQLPETWYLDPDDQWSLEKIVDYCEPFDTIHVGCDSKFYSGGTRFALAIAIYLNPCVTYWHATWNDKNMRRDIKYRIWEEVELSIALGFKLQELMPTKKISIHCDINADSRFPSHSLNTSAKGYVEGCGFEYKNKPGSWCATGCADYHTR